MCCDDLWQRLCTVLVTLGVGAFGGTDWPDLQYPRHGPGIAPMPSIHPADERYDVPRFRVEENRPEIGTAQIVPSRTSVDRPPHIGGNSMLA